MKKEKQICKIQDERKEDMQQIKLDNVTVSLLDKRKDILNLNCHWDCVLQISK